MHALKEAGWVDQGRIKSRQYDTKKHIFCAPDMVMMNKSDMRNLIEQ